MRVGMGGDDVGVFVKGVVAGWRDQRGMRCGYYVLFFSLCTRWK